MSMYYFYNKRNPVQVIKGNGEHCSDPGLGDNRDLNFGGSRGD